MYIQGRALEVVNMVLTQGEMWEELGMGDGRRKIQPLGLSGIEKVCWEP